MHFRIADTFTASLTKLNNEEQKAVKTTAFDLQINPAQPGLQFHKLDKVRDPHFWSLRVSPDIRLIVHRTEASLLLCYVDHHDKAGEHNHGCIEPLEPVDGVEGDMSLSRSIRRGHR